MIVRKAICFLLIVCYGMAHTLALAESPKTRANVELALLVQMLDYAQWVNENKSDNNTIFIGIYENAEILSQFRDTIDDSGKNNNIELVLIKKDSSDAELDNLKAIYFPVHRSHTANETLLKLRGRPILVIGSGDDFLKQGGIVRFDIEAERLVFDIDVGWSEKSSIAFRSSLLRLARKIYNTPEELETFEERLEVNPNTSNKQTTWNRQRTVRKDKYSQINKMDPLREGRRVVN